MKSQNKHETTRKHTHTQHSEMLLYVKFSTTDFLSFARIALLYLLLCLRKSLFAKQIFTKYYRREPHTDDSIHHVPICMCAKWEKNTHFCALYSRYGSKRRVYTRATGQCMQEYVWFGEKKWKKKRRKFQMKEHVKRLHYYLCVRPGGAESKQKMNSDDQK